MRLKKEFLICVTIILFILFLDIIFNNHFEHEKNKVDYNIYNLQEKIISNQDFDCELKDLNDNWNKFEEIASFYTEHNELEKISLKLNLLNKNIEISQFEYVIEYLEEIKFWLNHVLEKDGLKLKNIF